MEDKRLFAPDTMRKAGGAVLDTKEREIKKISDEFNAGFRFLKGYGLSASFFGGSRMGPAHPLYEEAYKLAFQLSKNGFDVITGGGPGIMEAANKGAYEGGGRSAGLNIMLAKKQEMNRYVRESIAFSYFFVRKVMLAFASEVYIFFPGGFGTLDEFFELVTLVQTKKIQPIPIIAVGKDYWTPLCSWLEATVLKKYKAIDASERKLFQVVLDASEAFKLIKKTVQKDSENHYDGYDQKK